MDDILREADSLRWALKDIRDRLEALQAAAEHIGAESAADSADEAADKVCEAISSLGEIYYEK